MFLRNGWYTALWSHELTEKPVGKRVNVLLVPEPPGVQVFPEQVV